MIKILFFIEELRAGGAEKVLCNLVNHMDQTRFDITVQTLWACDTEDLLAPGIRYKYCYRKQTGPARLRNRIETALGLTYPLYIRGDYDIEVAYLECGPTKVMAASTNKKAKKVAWVHCDLQKKSDNPDAFARKSGRWYAKYDRVFCVSQNVRDSFDEMFGTGFPAEVVYNTIDDEEIRKKAQLPSPDQPEKRGLTVVTLGRLTEQKGYDRLLRAHKSLRDEGILHNLWILGTGPEKERLEQFIIDNSLQDSVRLLGFHNNPYPYIREADCLVCSSRYEGYSTFITEGLILGKPSVTTDCTGMRELLGDSEYGLITENSEEGIREGLRRMLTDAGLREQYAQKAAKRGADFSARSLAMATEERLEALLRE